MLIAECQCQVLPPGGALPCIEIFIGSKQMGSDRQKLLTCVLRRSVSADLRPFRYQLSAGHRDFTLTPRRANSYTFPLISNLDRKCFLGSQSPNPIQTCAESDFLVYLSQRGTCGLGA
ncbi:uncharacterized protein LOC108143226 [Drosophila elegans]|uniref:uncharacterized protein LOC108143226 n=1 Tax=Drosophila elegans TaxID=30023 RepID=UPI0007E5FDF6|nr:uncharacterized protein LOC108143226 [Drosophila elegans]